MDNFFVISGCSGGGKTTLIAALARRGHAAVEEPGRRIVAEELAGDGAALPWVDPEAFARRAIDMAIADFERMRRHDGPVFFDRGLVDAVAALSHVTGAAPGLLSQYRYNAVAFMTPPWPEIFENDDERRHGLERGVEEYQRLLKFYPAHGYRPVILPKMAVEARVDFVLGHV
ncbi:AAA family ATPase [Martelella soudanensis]|uniref:AAA family ATPase n=1 Tax=unclassified Martelella TaxID=2629616 RepID=UPI0015DF047F|nr:MULTISPECIES: AAA family ATPase [unclassified Martelella]